MTARPADGQQPPAVVCTAVMAQVTKGQLHSVCFQLFISFWFSLYTLCEISCCEMNVSGQQRMGRPKKLVQDHKARSVGMPHGQQPMASPAPQFGSAKQEGIKSEKLASQNLAR